MYSTADDLREYLLALLRCSGPEAARDRLKLRHDWKLAHRDPSDAKDESESLSAAGTAAEHATEWWGLERLWDQLENLQSGIGAKLQPWLASDWHDIQLAVHRIEIVVQHYHNLHKLWPESLDRSLFNCFVAILVRPVTRRYALQVDLDAALQNTRHGTKLFERFLRSSQRRIPELSISEFIEIRRQYERFNVLQPSSVSRARLSVLSHLTQVRMPNQPKSRPSILQGMTIFMVCVVAVFAVAICLNMMVLTIKNLEQPSKPIPKIKTAPPAEIRLPPSFGPDSPYPLPQIQHPPRPKFANPRMPVDHKTSESTPTSKAVP